MVAANFGSALARKLNTFTKLSKEELGFLADLQSKPLRSSAVAN